MDTKLDVDKLPMLPGCYIFRNKRREIIYIGKSKCLRNRVKQYFYNTDTKKGKYTDLMRELHEIETIVTDTETNALILECQLIKKHKPKYNSQMKKTIVYPYLRIDLKQAFSPITITDSAKDDGCEYFGCFYSRDDAVSTLELINSIWQTPVCCKDSLTGKQRPCLNYHLKKCCAPCAGEIDPEVYRQKIIEIVKCLNGNYRNTLRRLKKEMEAESKGFNFERAACLRDAIAGLNSLKKKQERLYTTLDNRDVYMFFRAFNENCFSLFFIRDGITLNRLDCPGTREPSLEKLTAFINDNVQGKITIENGSFLTSCLLAIGARKLFVPVSKRINSLGVLKKIEAAQKEFIE